MHEIEMAIGPDYKSHQFLRVPGTTVTICAITLENGFVLIGKSACVHASSFDQELGEKYAAEDAIRQMGPFMGWREADRGSSF